MCSNNQKKLDNLLQEIKKYLGDIKEEVSEEVCDALDDVLQELKNANDQINVLKDKYKNDLLTVEGLDDLQVPHTIAMVESWNKEAKIQTKLLDDECKQLEVIKQKIAEKDPNLKNIMDQFEKQINDFIAYFGETLSKELKTLEHTIQDNYSDIEDMLGEGSQERDEDLKDLGFWNLRDSTEGMSDTISDIPDNLNIVIDLWKEVEKIVLE